MEEYGGYSTEIVEVLEKLGIDIYDRIRVEKDGVVYEGLLMPRPFYGDPRCIVIKLDNGYNIGIYFSGETRIRLVSKSEKRIIEEIKEHLREGEITVINTGGTISSKVDYLTGAVYPSFSAKDLYEMVPEIRDIAKIKARPLFNILSEDMTPDRWKMMAKAVYEEFKSGAKAVILTHGTDTMHYSAAALAFAVRKTPGPIVFVGAQRSPDRPSSDAFLNLLSAVITAKKAPFGESVIVMHGESSDTYCYVHRGVKARKLHTSRRDAFKSVNDRPIAKVENMRLVTLTNKYIRREEDAEEIVFKPEFDSRVLLVKVHPGCSKEIIEWALEKKFHGIVLEATGLGHVPYYMVKSIEEAVAEGVPVLVTSQCIWGRVNLNVYRRGVELIKAGVIPCEDMTPETALVKLMWTLAQTRDIERVRELMLTNFVYEINNRLGLISA
ncbi:MAG: Glu-tRNA(Gln) amidotransferase GatDE subunit D [Thermoprotei archaeon]|nr:MAG: Glu-tRNA(Gln) amidotransferase GatDE subunit D [Thermoprotei archaeon]RLF00509.1 MAG: Glu-tRNA(Gln) amidotransferase GatDE subunit D [Thermoprotei archaeon]HDI75346.1 Glu-tRNA(Gln) amidotransferase subunit GatD [Thermoprotei archaeon]